MNRARVAIADAGVNASTGLIQGDALTDDRPGTIVLGQAAYEYIQTELANSGVELHAGEVILANMAPAGSTDPSVFVNVGFTGYNDGAKNNATPFLPADLKSPLWIQQRVSGTQNYFEPDPPQTQTSDGLPTRIKTVFTTEWEWRGDALWFCGSTQTLDVRLRYNRRLPVLANVSQNVLILDSTNAMGYTIAAMFVASVNPAMSQGLLTQADNFIQQIAIQTTRKQQRASHRRMGYSQTRRGGWGRI